MTASNRYIPITCPKCGYPMQLGNSEDTLDTEEGWDNGKWEEAFTCPKCKAEFTMNVHFNVEITAINLAWVEEKEDE